MLDFKTSAGNTYAWDEETGIFIPYSPEMKAVVNMISNQEFVSREIVVEQLKDNFNREEIEFYYDWIKKWKKIKPLKEPQKYQKSSMSDIKRDLFKRGLTQLTLCITEDCNFRCNYCVYSDVYEHTRNHSSKYMDFTTAKKAIDYYFSLLKDGKRYHPLRKPAISFYGGEPLLNFETIKKCIEYIHSRYRRYDVLYNMTTNGSLLDKEKADWLIKHDFSISISLDGPEEEHNRNRLYRNKKGTFRDVMKNISSIMGLGYKYIYSLPVFDWKSNLLGIGEFFDRKDIPSPARVSQVNVVGRYYERFTEEDRYAFLEQIKKLRNYYFEELDHQGGKERASYFDLLVGENPLDDLFGGVSIYSRRPMIPFTSTCLPGTKIFVDVNGDLHACERVTHDFPIGNVDEGLDFERISQLISAYISSMDKCPDCKIKRKCQLCYAHFMTNKGFTSSSIVCKGIEARMKESFIDTFDIAERNPQLLEAKSKYGNIKKYCGE